MSRFFTTSAFIFISISFTAAACSGDDGTSAGESSGSTSAASATTSTSSTSAGTSSTSTSAGTDSGTGTTETSSSGSTSSPGTTDPGTTTTEPGTTGTTDPGTTGTTGTTGMGVDCSMLGPNQCKAEPMCMAIQGQKINVQKMCVQKVMFFECVEAMACGDAITVACDPDVMPPEPVQFADTCVPAGWMPCDFPPVNKPC